MDAAPGTMTPDEWILMPGGTYVGVSSATIWTALTGKKHMPFGWHPDVPADPDDFYRCHKLLTLVDGWRSRLDEVVARFPKWKPFVDAWDELEAMYLEALSAVGDDKWMPLYDRMCDIRGVQRARETGWEFKRRSEATK